MRKEFARLRKLLKKNFPGADLSVVRKAYGVAEKAHAEQLRLSGEPYIFHPLAVARILALTGLDLTTIAASLLHDVLEDTSLTYAELEDEFGKEIAALVDGVTKISNLYMSSTGEIRAENQAGSIRKMLVATIKDVRVLLIKLADRLHNMRTIAFLPPEKIKRISQETLDIYAPLALRLGIARWKWELEDHAFHRLHPDEYRMIAARVAMKRREREIWLESTIGFLEKKLAESETAARVIGRPKHLYSIYQKMVEQGKDFDEVMDILAVRIITQHAAGCYNALGVVHHLWTPIPGRFKDYVAMPKANGYQSIHTTVMCGDGIPLEIQIRTEEMDRTAQEGIAAHWQYKGGELWSDRKVEENLNWLRQMYEWLQDTHMPDELIDGVRRDVRFSEVYVFTPKGEVKELPGGATPLDFAYFIHSDIGNHCIGARVKGRMVPFRYNLQTGDVVEILTSKNQQPHIDWLDLVVTGRARTKIRQRLREQGDLEPVEQEPRKRVPMRPPPPKSPVRLVDEATREKLVRIEGKKGVAVQFAKCCNPMPGHAILGYATRNTGITIHRVNCRNFLRTERDPNRIIEGSWEGEGLFQTRMRVVIGQRPNVLADITNAIRPMNIDIIKADYRPGKNGRSQFEFVFDISDKESIERVARTIRTVAGVIEVGTIPLEKS